MPKRPALLAIAALVITGLIAACGSSGTTSGKPAGQSDKKSAKAWSYTDGSGKKVDLKTVPTRLVAHSSAAAALMSMGIKPVGIYADMPVKDDPELRKLDLSGIEIVGEAWGEIDIEKVLKLDPDLIVAEWWPLEKGYSGLEAGANKESKKVLDIAPIVGVEQGSSVHTMLQDYEKLAKSLGADLDKSEVAKDKADFERSLATFKAATAAKPGLTVLAISPTKENISVAAPAGAAELSDFARWGLQLVAPKVAEDRGYWETLSWENADKYQVDLLLVDDRFGPKTLQTAKAQPTWKSIKAAAAGSVVDWPAYWIRTYGSYAEELDALTAAIKAADENLVRSE